MCATEADDELSLILRYDQNGPYLVGGKCRICNETFFPSQQICPRCAGRDVEEVPLSRKGKLFTYTEVHQKPPDYGGPVPYLLGRVLLPEGVFILSQLAANESELKINMNMEMVVETIYIDDCGKEVKAFKFKPA